MVKRFINPLGLGLTEIDDEIPEDAVNVKGFGEWSNKGIPHSQSHKRKLSQSLAGHNVSEGTRNKISDKIKVLWADPEWRANQVEKRIGSKHTEEQKKKISMAVSGTKNPFYGKKHTEETKLKMRKPKRKKQYEQ